LKRFVTVSKRIGNAKMASASVPARIVADADVLAADLLCGGTAREALDQIRQHSWLTLVASEPLLDDAEAVIGELSDPTLAANWRDHLSCELVDHPADDHPALASAYRGRAAHVLSYDETLGRLKTGLSMQPHMQVSIRTPEAFVSVFDPEALYPLVEDGPYPGPDRDPRR
jgi:predicted nucleic acid-binding protein